jgi:hypothetical protein
MHSAKINMREEDLKNIWNNSTPERGISIDVHSLIDEMNIKISSIQKKIRLRDIREIAASVIGIIIYSYLLYEVPFPLTKFASILSILWFITVILLFAKSRLDNAVNGLLLSVQEQLEHQKNLMCKQVKLINLAAYWYSMPSFIINLIFIVGLENPSDYNWTNDVANLFLPISLNMKIFTLIGLAFFYAFIIWVNKRAVRKDLKPLLQDIETIQKEVLQNA